ncbi:MAG: leucine-rich repeat domain-containing protein [Clostridiales bacterium]|nr:leucine-rich repeat domain-containing protein [Clostridiales bacterium]
MKRTFTLVLAVVLCLGALPLMSLAAISGDYEYTALGGGTAEIVKYRGTGGSITIPSTLGGYPVTAIGTEAFRDSANLLSVVIPNGVTTIGSGAFHNCGKPASITVPGSVITISAGAFRQCASVTNITIPSGVTAIEAMAFSNCTKLTQIYGDVRCAETVSAADVALILRWLVQLADKLGPKQGMTYPASFSRTSAKNG